jgi:hypothetical protein
MPMASIFGRRSSLPTVSNAAERSNPTMATTLANAVVHDLPFLNPCWDVGRMLLAAMWASRSSLATVLSTFKSAHRMATGL